MYPKKTRRNFAKIRSVREELLGFVAIKGGTGGDGETMDSFTLLLSNQQQRVMKRPKMDVVNRSRSAFDPYSGAITIVRMAQSPRMRKPLVQAARTSDGTPQ